MICNEESKSDKSLHRKKQFLKHVVFSNVKFLQRERDFLLKFIKSDYELYLCIYGFDANYTKKELIALLPSDMKRVELKMISVLRPSALIKFKDNNERISATTLIKAIIKNGASINYYNVNKVINLKVPEKKKLQQSRVIIRNLVLKEDDESVYNILKICGPILNIDFLKKVQDDGSLKKQRCCFVQFYHEIDALKAISKFNLFKFNGVKIVLDKAIEKNIYKDRIISGNNMEESTKEIEESNVSIESVETSEKDEKEEKPSQVVKIYNNEYLNKTIFITNISWLSNEENLKKLIEDTFGKIKSCKLVYDKLIGRHKGSAFVVFENINDYENCIQNSKSCSYKTKLKFDDIESSKTSLMLDGTEIYIYPALSRDDVKNVLEKKKKKDSRNANFVKVGLIPENDENDFEWSNLTEVEKETRMEELKNKQEKLKDTNFHVSNRRLCIRHVPAYVDNSQFSRTFQKLSGKEARIISAKLSFDGKRSRCFGFVEFKRNEDALVALGKCANKIATSIFLAPPETKVKNGKQRLLVDFSLENQQLINTLRKRKKSLLNKITSKRSK